MPFIFNNRFLGLVHSTDNYHPLQVNAYCLLLVPVDIGLYPFYVSPIAINLTPSGATQLLSVCQ